MCQSMLHNRLGDWLTYGLRERERERDQVLAVVCIMCFFKLRLVKVTANESVRLGKHRKRRT
jgi:hypothetical protein